jgi:ferric-dicitrate binding protein FerR (iron transport regulator)
VKDKKDYFELLAGYFSGNIAPEDQKRVEEWIDLSEENKRDAQKIYDLQYTLDTLVLMNEIDANTVLRKMKRRISSKDRINKVKMWTQRIAVVLFIPLLVNAVLDFFPKDETFGYMEARSSFGLVSFLELPDGSKVWLNSGSYIKYPAKFKQDKREIYITGEAYLSIAKDENKKFIVNTLDNLSIEVSGTEFNLDAYESNDRVTTTLVEGAICLYYEDGSNALKKYAMTPGQQTVYSRETGKLSRKSTYVQKDIAWKKGSVIFRNTSFNEALWILSKRFNVDFVVKKESLRDYSFTGSFTDQNLIRILEHFRISSGINYSQQQIVDDNGEILKTEIDLY